MNINEKVLQDVLENTSLNKDEVDYQFNSILTSFENEEIPHNQLYLYLKDHYPVYLNTLYNIKVPSYKRPEPVKPQPTNQDFDNLLTTDILLNSVINTNEEVSSIKQEDIVLHSENNNSATSLVEQTHSQEHTSSDLKPVEQHTSFGIGSDTNNTNVDYSTPSTSTTDSSSTSVVDTSYNTDSSF